MSGHITQDWTPVKLKKSAPRKKTKKLVADAERKGDVQKVKKFGAGGQKRGGPSNAAKIEAEDADFHHKKISHEFKIALMKARTDKKLTQAQLAQKINVKQTLINQYETGKAIPDQQIISKLQRALGTRLPKIKKPKKKKNKD